MKQQNSGGHSDHNGIKTQIRGNVRITEKERVEIYLDKSRVGVAAISGTAAV